MANFRVVFHFDCTLEISWKPYKAQMPDFYTPRFLIFEDEPSTSQFLRVGAGLIFKSAIKIENCHVIAFWDSVNIIVRSYKVFEEQ